MLNDESFVTKKHKNRIMRSARINFTKKKLQKSLIVNIINKKIFLNEITLGLCQEW